MNNNEKLRFTCEGCFAPVTPISIKYHKCEAKIIAKREKERDEANKELNEIEEAAEIAADQQKDFIDHDYPFKEMTNEEILELMRDDVF